MGKGTIISEVGEGLYNVEINFDTTRLEKMIEELQTKIYELNAAHSKFRWERDKFEREEYNPEIEYLSEIVGDIEDILHDIEIEQLELEGLRNEKLAIETDIANHPGPMWEWYRESLQNALDEIQAEIAAKEAYISELMSEYSQKMTEMENQMIIVRNLKLELEVMNRGFAAQYVEIQAAEKRLAELQERESDDFVFEMWCADYTEELSGEVGIIEVPGTLVYANIQPGYDDQAAYNQTRDGVLMKTALMTPAQAYYAYAMLPGWQKWKPTYRHGIITAIDKDNDTATVTLSEQSMSTHQNLYVDQAEILENIPIEYMECNAIAFSVGDEVIIKFEGQEQSGAKIIGFTVAPKQCCEMVEALEGGVYMWPWTAIVGESYAEIMHYTETTDKEMEYYFEVDIPPKESIDGMYRAWIMYDWDTQFWEHTDLNISWNMDNVHLGTTTYGTTSSFYILFATDDDDVFAVILPGQDSIPETWGYLPEWEAAAMAVSDEVVDRLDISEFLAEKLGGNRITHIRTTANNGARFNLSYLKICTNPGAAPMPEP